MEVTDDLTEWTGTSCVTMSLVRPGERHSDERTGDTRRRQPDRLEPGRRRPGHLRVRGVERHR